MDRGAWQAAVHGVAEVGHDLAAKERERPEGAPKGEALAQRESRGGLQEENTGRREQNSLDSLFLCGTFPSPDSTPVQASFPSPSAGDLRELPRVPLRGEGSCGGGGAPRDSAGSGATEEGLTSRSLIN